MNPSPLFCSGLELGKLVVSSGLLRLAWSKISELNGSIDLNQDSNLSFRIYPEAKYTIVAFVAPSICTRRYLYKEDGSVDSALALLDGSSVSNPFRFLCSGNISSFSVHSPALQLFASAFDRLSLLRSQLLSFVEPLIITGSALGGSVASLFTLWLLDTIGPGARRPLCITFGSPLIGDTSLQQILENSIRNSCFLHVAATQDPVPKLLIPPDYSLFADDSRAVTFKPFGTFLLCYESGCVCVEDPDAVLQLLAGINGGPVLEAERNIYAEILHPLERSEVLVGGSLPGEPVSDWLLAGMFLAPDQIGRMRLQEHQNTHVIHRVIAGMEERAKTKLRFDPFKKLNRMKILMANLEWYKKTCRSVGIGYYDHFKVHFSERVERFKKELTEYWKSMVEEAEKKPQREKAAFSRRFLYAGNNYRRMIEPLDIAEHYRSNSRGDYRTTKSRHYILLQKWFDEAEKPENVSVKRDLVDLLTLDSCFWAKVEEAMISIESLKKEGIREDERESLTGKLDVFEKYVWEMIGKRTVSPEIFLEQSSFMRWWTEYKKFKGDEYSSSFADFMNRRRYKQYGISA